MALILSGDTGVPASGMPTGSVIQTVQTSTASQTASTTATYVDTALTGSITPTSTTSKILVTVYCGMCNKSSADTQLNIRIMRSGSSVFVAAALNTNATAVGSTNPTLVYLDSPATASSITYTLQVGNRDNSGTVYFNSNGTATLTLQEIHG